MEFLYIALLLTFVNEISSMDLINRERTFRYSVNHAKGFDIALEKEFNKWNNRRYRNISFTLGDEMCLDNCHGTCSTDFDGELKPCVQGTEEAPIYFTSRARQNKAICLSRCGSFGYSYEWCYIDEKYNWDYCSSAPAKVSQIHYSESEDRCATPCQLNEVSRKHKCRSVWGSSMNCDHNKVFPFVHAKTIYGVPCASKCLATESDKHTLSRFICYDVHRKNNYCAPPATKITSNDLKEMYHKLQTSELVDDVTIHTLVGK